MHYYLGIDMGTSSIKGTLVDEYGWTLCRANTPVRVENPQEGFYEIEAERTWWAGFKEVTQLFGASYDLSKVKAITVSSLCGTFVPVDEDMKPVYNAILYGMDTRSKEQVKRLNGKFGEKFLERKLGSIYTTHSTVPKVLWLKENLPDVYKRTAHIVESNNYVSSRLTGKFIWDYPTAFGSQLVDEESMEVTDDLIEAIGLRKEIFPRLGYVTDVLGKVVDEETLSMGYSPDCLVMVGGCDVNAEAASVGAVKNGDMLAVFGSTLSTLMTCDRYTKVDGFKPGLSVLKGSYRLGTGSSAGARTIQWIDALCSKRCAFDFSSLPTGILTLPYLDGARSPYDNPSAFPVIANVGKHHTLNDIELSIREALCYEVALLISLLEDAGIKTKAINCTGGLSNDKKLMSLLSTITGKTVRLFSDRDASYGDAFISLLSENTPEEAFSLIGVMDSFKPKTEIGPNEALMARYAPLREKYISLYPKIERIFE